MTSILTALSLVALSGTAFEAPASIRLFDSEVPSMCVPVIVLIDPENPRITETIYLCQSWQGMKEKEE